MVSSAVFGTAGSAGRTASERSFGFLFAGMFAAYGVWPVFHGHPPRLWAVVLGGALLAVTLIRPLWLRPANRLWFAFSMLLHRVMNPLIMGILFFGVVTPIGWLMRMAGEDPLAQKLDRSKTTYWSQSTSQDTDMNRQF